MFSSAGGGAPAQPNNGNLTTVISSALDYKRFLDRRKQAIQQQVESAQQASAARRVGDHSSAAALGGPAEVDISGDCAAATEASTRAGDSTLPRRSGTTGGSPKGGDTTADLDETNLEDGSSPGTCAASGPVSAKLRGMPPPGPTVPYRSHTPTRYTQSSGAPAGVLVGGGGHDLSSDASASIGGRTMRVASVPAGAGRVSAAEPDAATQDHAAEAGVASANARAATAPVQGAAGRGALGVAHAQRRGSSQDALLRDPEPRPLTGGSVEDYIVGKQVGQGAYATVCFGLHKETSRKVAIKIYDKYKLMDPQRRKSVRSEIHLMERMRHPNVVIFHEALDTPKQIFLIMEYVGGGSLHHFLKKRPGRRLDDQLAKRIFFQVCQGIRYMHERHIVHRDVKLENLLLDEQGVVKIIDFGFSTVVPPGKKLKIFCGTPSYMSPEIVARKEYLGFCADIWAMGVLLYALLCGSFPFRGQNDRDLYRKIVRGVFNTPDHVGDGARSLLSRVLTTDMARRPSVEDVLADQWLSHHKDELYSAGKGASSGYQPNSSTSSTATTAAPSSSTGQSARENVSREYSAAVHAARAGGWTPQVGAAASSSSGATPPAPPSMSAAGSGVAAVRAAASASQELTAAAASAPAAPHAGGASTAADAADRANAASAPSGVGVGVGSGRHSELPPRPESSFGDAQRPERIQETGTCKRIEEEAICKLERLGYPRDEIVRQLKDESSHLCKLYHRFLKALTAWDKK